MSSNWKRPVVTRQPVYIGPKPPPGPPSAGDVLGHLFGGIMATPQANEPMGNSIRRLMNEMGRPDFRPVPMQDFTPEAPEPEQFAPTPVPQPRPSAQVARGLKQHNSLGPGGRAAMAGLSPEQLRAWGLS